ncbi:MAG: T9SS type A sorting domain-containing protein [Bacteroidia bacterium]
MKAFNRKLTVPKQIAWMAVAGLLLLSFKVSGQSVPGTYNVIHQPCNADGELAIMITSGVTPPLDYYYSDVNGGYTYHMGVASMTDTLFGITAAINSVYVLQSGSGGIGGYFYTPVSMLSPFSIDPPVITDAICPSLTGSIQLTINGGSAPSSVQWFNSTAYGGLGSTAGIGNPVTLPPGYYGAIVTNSSGCIVTTGADSSSTMEIRNISGISFSVATTTASCTNGTAAITGLTGGTLPYTYSWSNGATTTSISGLTQGTYSATVTDFQGCNTSASGDVIQSVTINANPVTTSATCLLNDGSVITFGSGGTPPYTYFYSNGMSSQSIGGLPGNTSLLVTATDANGCIGTSYLYIGTSTPIIVSNSSTPSSCTSATGSATLSISGGTVPYTVSWNTTPAMSGATISGMLAGSYAFTVTDASGCVQTGTAVIPPVSTINATAYNMNPVCPVTTGTVGVNVTGSDPPFTYSWNTGATTPSISGASLGNYYCVVSDNAGCSVTKYASLGQTSPINIGYSTVIASCMYAADGVVYANATGGLAPYSYNWSNGQTGPTATGLVTGDYWVTVQDANGCWSNYGAYDHVGYDPLNTSCYCTITGKVYADANSNCIFDSGEQGIEHIMIHCLGFGYTFTDVNGNYSFTVPTGSYTLSESVEYAYPLAPCQSNSIPVSVTASSGCISTVDFANNINTIHDMHIVRTQTSYPVPGNTYTQGLIVMNDGTVNESSIQLSYRSDGQLNLVSTTPPAYTQLSPGTEPNWYSVTGGFPSLAPGASTMIYFTDLVPTTIPLATNVFFNDTANYAAPITDWVNDYTPWNNVNTFQTTVVGSYDPNFKEVSPKGTGPQGYITTADSSLDYVVHFQNTGTSYANKVVVIDTLDANLDITSLRPGYSDHLYTASISETGVLTFTFDNIHLDWQENSETASRGLISYSIKQKPGLTIGTEIRNRAAIYFDYNQPVLTNQTLNTIGAPLGITGVESSTGLLVYPDPATNELNIDLGTVAETGTIRVFDLQGRTIIQEAIRTGASRQKISVSELVNGIYLIELQSASGIRATTKFIKN